MKRIRLLAPHTHAGEPHALGAELPVPDHVADWLVAHGIGEPCNPRSARNQVRVSDETAAAIARAASTETTQPASESGQPAAGEPAAGADQAGDDTVTQQPHDAETEATGDDHE